MGELLRRNTVIILFLAFCFPAKAQNYSIKDSTLVDSLMQLSMHTYYKSPIEALPHARKALYITNKINYANGFWQCYNGLAIIHRTIGNTDSGFYYSNKNIELYYSKQTRKDSIAAQIEIVNLAGSYIKQGEILTALETCQTAMEYLDAVKDTHGMMSVRGRLSNIYAIVEDHPTARKYSNEQLDLIRELSFKQARIRTGAAYRDIGESYSKEGNYDMAMLYYDSSHMVFKEIDDSMDIVITDIAKSEVYLERNEIEKAFPLIKHSLNFTRNHGTLNQTVFALHQMHEYYIIKNQLDSARYYGELSLETAQKVNNLIVTEELYYQLALIYEELGEKDKTIDYLKKHKVISDSLKQESVYRNLQAQKYTTQLKQAELEKMQAIAESDKKNETITNLGVLGMIALVVIIILVLLGLNVIKSRKTLRLLNEELLKNNEIKNRLLAIISHDIRSPLSSLYGVIKLTKDGVLTTEQTRELIDKLEDKFNTTLSLVDNLLYWTKNQINAIEPHFTKFNIKEVIETNTKSIKTTAAEKDITIKTSLDDKGYVYADKNMIDIVIRNLLSNAIKFTKPGGDIKVITHHQNNKLKLEVIDTGIGMSDEKLASLFTANNTSELGTQKEKGTGLGLLVSYEFIKTNNSNLHVKSIPGKGTSFYFELISNN